MFILYIRSASWLEWIENLASVFFLSTYKKNTVFDIDSPRPNDFKMSVGFLQMAHYTLK